MEAKVEVKFVTIVTAVVVGTNWPVIVGSEPASQFGLSSLPSQHFAKRAVTAATYFATSFVAAFAYSAASPLTAFGSCSFKASPHRY